MTLIGLHVVDLLLGVNLPAVVEVVPVVPVLDLLHVAGVHLIELFLVIIMVLLLLKLHSKDRLLLINLKRLTISRY